MDGIGHAGVLARHHVVARVAAENRYAALVEQRKACRLTRGRACLARVDRTFDIAAAQVAGADQQHIALFDLESAAFFGGKYVFGHHAFAALYPVHAANHRRVHEDAARCDAFVGKLDRLDRCAKPGGYEMRWTPVVHLALPEEVGEAVHVRDVVAVERHAEEVSCGLTGAVRHLVAACPALAALQHEVERCGHVVGFRRPGNRSGA